MASKHAVSDWYDPCCKSRIPSEKLMKINPSQETAASLLSTAISRDKLQTDFQASLDLAQQFQNQRSSKAPEPSAMQDALAAARKELEEYIAKGPIAHMREAILKEMGLAEEDLEKMPPEQRAAVEETIARKISEQLLADSAADPKRIQAFLLGLPFAASKEKKEQTP
jgi:hypothetical protein